MWPSGVEHSGVTGDVSRALGITLDCRGLAKHTLVPTRDEPEDVPSLRVLHKEAISTPATVNTQETFSLAILRIWELTSQVTGRGFATHEAATIATCL